MSLVAEQLRQAREAQKLTIERVAEITKIRGDHVRAIENGDFQVFSAPVYIRGFVRTYCNLLKLDPAKVLADLDLELAEDTKLSKPPGLDEPAHGPLDSVMLQLSKIDWRKSALGFGALLAMLAVVAAVIAWRHYRKTDPLKGLKPGIYQSTQDMSGETLPLPATKK
jgi:cytoskeletal protein RodZ